MMYVTENWFNSYSYPIQNLVESLTIAKLQTKSNKTSFLVNKLGKVYQKIKNYIKANILNNLNINLVFFCIHKKIINIVLFLIDEKYF